jgi:hypothetical protein
MVERIVQIDPFVAILMMTGYGEFMIGVQGQPISSDLEALPAS